MGGRAKAKKARARKELEELGLGDMIKGLHEVFEELQEAPPSTTNARNGQASRHSNEND